jgi:protocatechuate 3,4-dioxygenase beta subunit
VPLDLAQEITGPLVLTKRIRVGQGLTGEGPFEEITQIAGTVRNEQGQPLAGATVSVREKGFTAWTDEEGRYTFPNLEEGQYTLVVSAPGREPAEHMVTVMSPRYDLAG